jgi:hypothetical protein
MNSSVFSLISILFLSPETLSCTYSSSQIGFQPYFLFDLRNLLFPGFLFDY